MKKSILCACVCRFNGGFVLFLRYNRGRWIVDRGKCVAGFSRVY